MLQSGCWGWKGHAYVTAEHTVRGGVSQFAAQILTDSQLINPVLAQAPHWSPADGWFEDTHSILLYMPAVIFLAVPLQVTSWTACYWT